MSVGAILKKIICILVCLIAGAVLCITVFFLLLSHSVRKRVIAEAPVSPVVQSSGMDYKACVMFRHYYPGGVGNEPLSGLFLIIENNEGEQFESGIPFRVILNETYIEKEIKALKATMFDLSWDSPYTLTIQSSNDLSLTTKAYFISDYLHVFDVRRDSLVSGIGTAPRVLPEDMLTALEPLKIDKDILSRIQYIDLSDYDPHRMGGTILNEDPMLLLYIKNGKGLLWSEIMSAGPVLFEDECFCRRAASLQWVFFKDSSTYDNEIYTNQIFFSNNEGKLKAMNTTPIILEDTK